MQKELYKKPVFIWASYNGACGQLPLIRNLFVTVFIYRKIDVNIASNNTRSKAPTIINGEPKALKNLSPNFTRKSPCDSVRLDNLFSFYLLFFKRFKASLSFVLIPIP